jgi:hypothetical protein
VRKHVGFFEIYSKQECLWDLAAAQCKNKQAREAVLLKIMEKMGMPAFWTGEVKQKIKNLG